MAGGSAADPSAILLLISRLRDFTDEIGESVRTFLISNVYPRQIIDCACTYPSPADKNLKTKGIKVEKIRDV